MYSDEPGAAAATATCTLLYFSAAFCLYMRSLDTTQLSFLPRSRCVDLDLVFLGDLWINKN